MENNDFNKLMTKFKAGSTDDKINIYTTTEGLTNEQYRELLLWFPRTEMDRLEKALS